MFLLFFVIVSNPKEETPNILVILVYVGQFNEKKLDKTKSGAKRHPDIFLGFREEKEPYEIIGMMKNRNPYQRRKHLKKQLKKLNGQKFKIWRQL
jgi:hypothetical protein